MIYDEIYEYLRDKIVRTNVNNPKANWGARLLSQHMDLEDLRDILIAVIDTIQMYFHTNNEGNPSGQANLSNVSMTVGRIVLEEIGYNPDQSEYQLMTDKIRTGDLFIEAFVRNDLLKMERLFEVNKNGDTVDAGYVLKVTLKWVAMLNICTKDLEKLQHTDTKPYTDGCLIKGEGNKRMQDRPWRRSATKLMSTPWRINEPVLEALRANRAMFVSDRPIDVPIDKDGTPDPYLELQELRRISKLADFIIVTAKAGHLVGKDFYQDMEADYRGRLYYKEPFLNFQGSDLARGIMVFGEEELMTEEGKWWLAVHTACSYNMSYDIDEIPSWCEADYKSHLMAENLDSISVDKFTLEDRVRWTNEYMDTILHAGRNRLLGEDAEKSVTFLACCIEWASIDDAERAGTPYYSRLPVGIDGSNNGWQHLGAISRDLRTGELVGLVAGEIQQDFYVQTAKELLTIDDPKLNNMPMKHVRKGISKRGSMTRAYSAGADKIGKNMWFDCRSAEFDKTYNITEEDCMVWAKELIRAIATVCPGPLSTMKYMQDLVVHHIGTYEKYRDGESAVAEWKQLQKELNNLWTTKKKVDWDDEDYEQQDKLIEEAKQFYSVLVKGNGASSTDWVTPSGFPVNYTAWREDDFKCKGTINGKRINHVLKVQTKVPDIHKYMCGISPNYIHSMDASHMANTIDNWEGTFGAVHDSFSTHASKVEDLLALTKDEFVKMYAEGNALEKIRQDITGGTDDVKQPTLGDLDIQEVYDSDYFFA